MARLDQRNLSLMSSSEYEISINHFRLACLHLKLEIPATLAPNSIVDPV